MTAAFDEAATWLLAEYLRAGLPVENPDRLEASARKALRLARLDAAMKRREPSPPDKDLP